MQDALLSFLNQGKQDTDQELKLWFDEQTTRFEGFSPEYQELLGLLRQLVLRGGKRSRPLLVRFAASLATPPDSQTLLRLSLYPELLHVFLLIHDDIADNDQLRYGGPTLEQSFLSKARELAQPGPRFGIGGALVTGDLLHVLANDLLWSVDLASDTLRAIHATMQTCLAAVVDGWYCHQVQNAKRVVEVSPSQYLAGLDQVSASYSFQAPLAIGSIAGNAPDELKTQLHQYGLLVGRAYQIQDDWMSIFGDPDSMGKPVGNDIREGKKTLFVLETYQSGNQEVKTLIDSAVGHDLDRDTLDQVRDAIRSTGAEKKTLDFASTQIDKAIQLVSMMQIDEVHKHMLEALAQFALKRNH